MTDGVVKTVTLSEQTAGAAATALEETVQQLDPTEQAMMRPMMEELSQAKVQVGDPKQVMNVLVNSVSTVAQELVALVPEFENLEVKAGVSADESPATRLSGLSQRLADVISAAKEAPAMDTMEPLLKRAADVSNTMSTVRPTNSPTAKP